MQAIITSFTLIQIICNNSNCFKAKTILKLKRNIKILEKKTIRSMPKFILSGAPPVSADNKHMRG